MPSGLQLLDPGKIIALAHAANPREWGKDMPAQYPQLLHDFLRILQERKIPFVVVGGIALLNYIHGRNTEDINLILSAPRLTDLPELVVRDRNEMFARADFGGLQVDLLFLEHPLFAEIAQRFSAPIQYQIGSIPTATVEGLILLKLFALRSLYRQFDLDRVTIYEADVTQLLDRTARVDGFFLGILAKHLPVSDLKKVGSILHESRQKIRRLRG